MNWERVIFESLYATPSKNGVNKPSYVRGEGIKMVNMGELFQYGKIGDIPMERVPMTDRELASSSLEEGDLLFARQSLVLEGAGKCSIVQSVSEPTTFEGHLIRVRLNERKADSQFFYYYFGSPLSPVRTIVQQCAQAGIKASELAKLSVHCPPPPTQRRIAAILSAYDDLIENNRRRIQLLEQAARLIYQEWFVRLRFPGHERVRVVDGVPEGWGKKRLGDILVLNYGKGLKEADRIEGDVPVYGSSGIVGSHHRHLAEGPGIIVGRKGNVGSVFWSQSAFFPIDTVYYVDSETSSLYLFHLLQSLPFQSSDGAVPGLNRNYAYSLPVRVPSPGLVARFEGIARPIYQQILNLQRQNERLRLARDLLLPKLMSGEIEVSGRDA